jgi:hypothetical protein
MTESNGPKPRLGRGSQKQHTYTTAVAHRSSTRTQRLWLTEAAHVHNGCGSQKQHKYTTAEAHRSSTSTQWLWLTEAAHVHNGCAHRSSTSTQRLQVSIAGTTLEDNTVALFQRNICQNSHSNSGGINSTTQLLKLFQDHGQCMLSERKKVALYSISSMQ